MKSVAQVPDVMRDVLANNMTQGIPEFSVRRAILVGKSGRLIGENQILDGSGQPAGIRLTMESGDEYELTLQ
jgi:hypothetical protein